MKRYFAFFCCSMLLLLFSCAAAEEVLAPTRLLIPSIGADSPMEPTQIIEGELQVMDGGSIVSYWGNGPLPGDYGNALLAAHNMWAKEYTPYAQLPAMEVGDEIIIEFSDGSQRRFTLDSVAIYTTGQVPSALWRGIGYARFCTMISCAGEYSDELGTHDQRCVIVFSMEEHKLLGALEKLVAERLTPIKSEESALLPRPRPAGKAPAPSVP